MTDPYTPVSCGFQDQLEELATLHREARIVYRNEADEKVEAQGQIVDIYAADKEGVKADFLKLDSGTEIRLDKVVLLNGEAPVCDEPCE